MRSFLKNHPFEVETHFESSLVFTFAVPKEELIDLIPKCLELDIYKDKWAFLAVAMVETKNLRPKGFPQFFGNDFFLIGYRIFVRYTNIKGKKLRGLYILKSETNKKKMELLGNIFTHYNYSTTDVSQKNTKNEKIISSTKSGISIKVNTEENETSLPTTSPFELWKEARRYAGPLPFTFTYLEKQKKILIIEGVRKNWTPRPVEVIDFNFSFLNNMKFTNCRLASAFIIENIPYYWKKGKLESWVR